MFGFILGTASLLGLGLLFVGAHRRHHHRLAWAHAHGPFAYGHGHGHAHANPDAAGDPADPDASPCHHRHARHAPPWAWRHRHAHGADHPRGPHGPRGPRRHRSRRRMAHLVHEAARRLNLDEHQRDVVDVSVKEANKALATLKDIVVDSRDELADAVKGETLDQARLDAVFEKWDASMKEARRDLVDALRRAHATLEPEQRRRLAEWITLYGEA